MNANSANALLKALEEPHAKSLFLLTTKNLNFVLPTITSRCQKVFIYFNEINKINILETISDDDFNQINSQINVFKNCFSYLSDSLIKKENGSLSSQEIKNIIELSERLAKEYTTHKLQDLIVFATNERLKKEHSFLTIARSILSCVTDWKNAESMNPSTQLWLLRIFMGYRIS